MAHLDGKSLVEIGHFFGDGDDSRLGQCFTQLNYSGTNFSQSNNGLLIQNAMVCKNYRGGLEGCEHQNDIHPEFVNFIIHTGMYHASIDRMSGGVHKKWLIGADTNEARLLIDNVFKKWSSIDNDVKTFYSTFFNAFKVVDGREINVDLSEVDATNQYRLNFKKVLGDSQLSGPMVFATSLPLIPRESLDRNLVININCPESSVPSVPLDTVTGVDSRGAPPPSAPAAVRHVRFAEDFAGAAKDTLDVLASGPVTESMSQDITKSAKEGSDFLRKARRDSVAAAKIVRRNERDEAINDRFYDEELAKMHAEKMATERRLRGSAPFGAPPRYDLVSPPPGSALLPPIHRGGGRGIAVKIPIKNDQYKLQKLYLFAYSYAFENYYHTKGGDDLYAGVKMDRYEEQSIDCFRALNHCFSLDQDVMIRKSLLEFKMASEPKSVLSKKDDCVDAIDELFLDMSSGIVYKRGDDGRLYKDENGKKVYVSDMAMTQGDKCLSTGVKPEKCSQLVKCITSNDSDQLENCIRELGKDNNQDVFAIAENDVKNTHPDMIKMLLRRFGVQFLNEYDSSLGRKINKTEDFNKWLERTLKDEKISKNDSNAYSKFKEGNLVKYIRGLMAIIKANPLILNDDLNDTKLIVPSDVIPKEWEHLGLKLYANPFKNNIEALSYSATLLNTIPIFNKPALSPFFAPGTGIAMSVPGLAMGGGSCMYNAMGRKSGEGSVENSKIIYNMFVNAFKEMKLNGKSLDETDKQNIHAALDRLEKLESNLIKLYKYMDLFNKLVKFVNSNGGKDNEPEVVKMRDLQDKYRNAENLGLDGYLKNALSDLKLSLDKNVNQQGLICQKLLNGLYPHLIQVIGGESSSVIVPVP